MRRVKVIYMFLCIFVLIAVTGCNSLGKDEKIIITSKDGGFELAVPSTWKEDEKLNEQANLQISNRKQEKYLVVINENKSDFNDDLTLQEYAEFVKEGMKKSGEDVTIDDSRDITINGGKALYLELSGLVENIKVKYIVVIAEDTNSIYQIIGWTMESKFQDSKDEIMSIIESLKAK